MKRYVVGQDRSQSTLFPEVLDDYIAEDNPVRVVDVFVDELDLQDLGFEGAEPADSPIAVSFAPRPRRTRELILGRHDGIGIIHQ
jgi:hypothetical protein